MKNHPLSPSHSSTWIQAFGHFAEDVVSFWLESRGYRVLERRYRCRFGELDIVSERDGTLLVVEVKALSGRMAPKHALAGINRAKQRRLFSAVNHYLWKSGRDNPAIQVMGVGLIVNADGSILMEMKPCLMI